MPVTINGTTGVVTPGATIGSINGILKSSSGVVSQAVAGTDYLVGGGSAITSTNTAKAWVNFNGTTSPGTIRSSYNVSSITKNGTGDYTVNFATPMADANYSFNVTSGISTASALVTLKSTATSNCSFVTTGTGAIGQDCLLNCVQVFGN